MSVYPPEELISMQYPEEINDSENPQNFVPFSYRQPSLRLTIAILRKAAIIFHLYRWGNRVLRTLAKDQYCGLHCEHKPVVAEIHTQALQNQMIHYF